MFKIKSLAKRLTVSALSLSLIIQHPISVPIAKAEPVSAITGMSDAPEHKLSLWYRQPAISWETDALPIGNGLMGGMVFGGVEQERIQLNEKTLWSGGPGSSFVYTWPSTDEPTTSNPYTFGNREDGADHLENVRAKLREGDIQGAHKEANDNLTGLNEGLGSYQTFGDLYLDFEKSSGKTENYRRELDLEDAISRVKYTLEGVEYTREYFISYPDKVMVTRLTANQPGKLSLDVRPTSAQGGVVTASGNNINIRGNVVDNNMLYEGNFRVLHQGGSITTGNGKIHAANVDSLTILTSLGTNYANSYPNYRGTDPHNEEVAILDAAESKSYETLLENHKKDYKSLFDRVKLDLAESKPTIPTNELLATYAGAKSKALEVLFYQYGRYLLISSSRAGSLPANLQGVWNNSNRAPWSSDHHFNINIQMNYWPAMVTNLQETMTPLIDYIDSLRTPGRISSEKYYGITNAWSIGVANNPFGYTAPGWDFDWGWSPASNAFISNNIWESYKFSGDIDLLKSRVYPILKETAQFWTKFLVEDSDGTLVSTPCYSPEQGTISAGCAYDQQLVQDLFTNYLEASTTLGVDSEFREEVQSKLNRVSPIKIGKYGQIQEWKEDIDDPNNKHRHLSQLVALYPGKQINKNTPELMEAAKVSLQHRGDEGTGWSKANKINMWARAQDGTHAHTILEGQLTGSTLNNLFDTHPPFQIDGNFGATSGMSEMLLQSHLDNIDILPALPASWPKGSYSGLVARGGFEVSVNWNNARATNISVKSNKGNRAVVTYPSIAGAIVMDQAGQSVKYSVDNNNQISFDTQVGGVYTIGSIPLQDGQLYKMTMKNSGHLLDIEGASEEEQAAVVQMPEVSLVSSQQWYIEGASDGFYKITNNTSKKVIAVLDSSKDDGAKLVQQTYTSDNSYNDEWLLVDKGNGYYQLVNRGSDKALTASNNSIDAGAQLIQSSITDSNEQLLKIDPVRDLFDQQTFNLTLQHSNFRMDVNEDSKADGAAIIQWSAGSGWNQQWMFMKTKPGFYKIISMSSSKVLAVENASTADGAGIIQTTYTDDATYNDEWSVVDVGDGHYQLKNRASGKVIEIPDNSLSSGEQFVQNKAGTGSNQKFEFSLDRTVNDNATGSGSDQFVYSSGWDYSSSEAGAFSRDNHYSNKSGSYSFLRFTGSKVQLYGAKNDNQGIVAFSIDDGPEQLVDTYASSRLDQQLLFESSEMLNQEHVLKIRVTDQKNANANNTFISVDRADIQSRVVKGVDKAEDYYKQTKETINGVNYSVITLNYKGEDAGEAVRAAIEAAKKVQKPVILDFPTETYHFKASTAKQVQYFISNTSTIQQTPSSTRKVGLLFKDIEDLTIRGNGSTLLFHGVMTPIVFDHATNIKVNGINIDFNRPVVSEMTVTEVGNNYMKASIHPDSWYSIQNNQLVWFGEENWTENGTQNVRVVQEYNPVTKQTWRVDNPLDGSTSAKDLGKREVQFSFSKKPNVTVGNTFQLRDTARREQGALIYRSKDIAWSDVNFYAAPGLGIVSQYSENVTLDKLSFAPKAGSGRTNASMADFLQVSGSKGEIQVSNSYFAGAQDDAINIHGTHLQIVQIPASNQVKVQFMHPESWGFDAFAVGDRIEYINKSTLLSKESAVVTGVTRLNDTQIVLTLDKAVPSSVTANEYVVENVTWTPNVTITNSTFETIPTRGILVTTLGAVRIENNTFNGMQMSAILITDDANSWYESGMVKDVLIRNNTFNNNGNAVISVEPSTSLTNPDKTVHSHIVIDGNQFNKTDGNSEIYAKSVDGFTFTNNTANQGGFALSFDASKAVTIAGNSFAQSDVDKKINFNRMIVGTDSVEASQGFVVTRTNDYTPTVSDPNEIPQSEMTATSTSNHSGNEASNVIDGEPSTYWHSEWDPMAELPQSITLDLGKPRMVSKLKYLPRQNGSQNGNITSYELSTSLDGTTFSRFTSGNWSDDSNEKMATFAPVTSRYLKLTVTAGHGGYASVAELHVSKDASDVRYQELVELITNAQGKHDSAVEGSSIGHYPAGSKQTLQTAINSAKQAINTSSITSQQLQKAFDVLNTALKTFESLKINDSNGKSITITSTTNRINVKGGSLPLGVVVLPVDQPVTWSVFEVDGTATDKAIINQSGVLTAAKDGNVKVIATATRDSSLFGEKVIVITGQNDENPSTDPTNREELNFNTGWLFKREDVSGAQSASFDDSAWEGVNLPHSVRLEPKISGGANQSYQGFATYRRHFTLDNSYSGKKLFIEFEGAMINAEVWINGNYLGVHHGGYTPFTFDITKYVLLEGATNVITVKLDNRDDPQTPPGKPQSGLDFEYFGGLYRDVKLHVMDNLHVTDAIYANKVADGGIFVTYPEVSKEEATVQVKTNIINENASAKNTSVKTTIVDSNNQVVATMVSDPQKIVAGSDYTFVQSTTITKPQLWHPDHPNLYTVYTAVNDGTAYVDSYKTRIGIRHIQFTPDQGFLINGEKLMLNGANRHQEFLYVGNAMPNSGQYRDAKQLREGGFNNVRTGHYPQDPAFLDAADELGLTVISPTPGWQFFGDSVFQERSYQAIRDMVRRDRNHPSIIMWESSLNETTYSLEYAQNAHKATHEEYPGDQTYTSAEYGFFGKEVYDVNYKELDTAFKPLFTREWGDDWSESATSPTGYRSVRKVGETDMINSIIMRQKALNGDGYFDWAGLNANPRIAGHSVWSFNDYNRGMDSDPAYSGLVDLDRYPKFNYYFFQSQRNPGVKLSDVDSGPMVYIANYWTPSSSRNVTVASNTEQVQLYLNDTLIATQSPDSGFKNVTHPTFTFNNVSWAAGTLRADGLIDGEVAASHTVKTPGQPHHLAVEYDTKRKELVADGSDLVMAYITVRDADNNIVPTNHISVSLNLSGPGGLIGNGVTRTFANPVAVEGGVAAALVKSSLVEGTLKLSASASGLLSGSAEITTVASQSVFVPGGSDGGDHWFEGENVALNKPVTTSSAQSGNPGTNGNDGNETTGWVATNSNSDQWWEADLGEVYNITGSEIVWASSSTYNQYKIDVSEDQANWTNILDKTQNTTTTTRQREKLVANARYVRVTLTGVQNGQASFNELKVFGVAPFQNQATQHPELVNVALNKSVSASSLVTGNEASNANDGINATWWEASSNAPGWWQVDLGASYNLTGSKILWGRDNIYYSYRIEVSSNGKEWSQVAGRSASGQDMKPDNYMATGVRYVRVFVDSLAGGSGTEKPAIKEIQVYSDPKNIALNKPATADSSQRNNPISAGNDGNETTRWSADDGNVGHWYKVDLGAIYDLSGTRVKWEMDNKNYGYRIEVSDDDVNWASVAQKSSSQQVQFDYFNTHARYVRIHVTEMSDGWASFWEFEVFGAVPVDTSLIPQSQMTATATSEETSGEINDASQAIDGNPSTIWHTKWDLSNPLPQSITLNLGNTHVISTLKYLPRQNGAQNGNITSYEILTSLDGVNFTPATSGSWDNDSTEKVAEFTPVASRYLRLTAIEGHGGLASAAEINIMKNEMDEDYQALEALITSVQSKHDSAIEGNENGQYPEGSKQTLQKAIDQAKKVRDSLSVTQQQLQQAANDLTAALKVMEESINNHEMVQSIMITSESSVITTKNGTLQLGAAVLPTNANKSVTWAVYEVDGTTATDKATIDLSGLLTAVKDGTVKVVATATDGSGVHDEMDISISGQTDIIDPGTDPVHVGKIHITSSGNVSTITAKNGTLQLGATVLPANATNKSVTWAVYGVDGITATDIATIDVSGLLTAVKDGTVKVVATAVDGSGVQGDMVITISGQTDIIDPGTETVYVGTIDITSAGNVSTITVKNGSLQLSAIVLPENATNKSVTWSLFEADGRTATDKATIDVHGLLTAVKDGIVKVVVTANDGSAVVGEKSITITGQSNQSGNENGNGNTTTPQVKEDPNRYVLKETELRILTQDGQTSVKAVIDSKRLAQKLADLMAAKDRSVLHFEIPGEHDLNAVEFPLPILYNSMKGSSETIFTLRSHWGSYELPLSILNREEFEKAAKVEGATLIIRMDNATSQHEQKFEQSIVDKGMKRVSDIITFKVILKTNDKEEEIQSFGNSFVTRVIYMDGAIQDPSTATAVIFDPATGQMRFVPSVFTVKNGKTEVTIFGQANGIYAIVQNKKTFDDMIGHWAQKDVETLASKLIINGMTDRTFAPASQVTRAQFTALLVRALGLSTESLLNVFADVSATAWYAQDVNTAAKLGLVQGVGEKRFSPDTIITREQMIVMIMKAVHLVQGEQSTEAQVRAPFADQNLISDYASQAVTEAASKGLIEGKTEITFAPQDAATRAEAAVIIKHVLQYLKFIN
ncbi:discoidin domain-containing protein [Paenibacillus sp. G2S3]|uniref:glycosyl hydrolase family 95 catalytic domain-containing protein n=1 Tax=Paenibacillus sp. G2S3 TaxID=3047872 RepID=UPI0024C10F03|nr:discoidin domain-containing protein [Paenibacillus sp. G2S3]WHY22128.1 discoidin domain-containing protein [Paenibacillus sp. G2S3]